MRIFFWTSLLGFGIFSLSGCGLAIPASYSESEIQPGLLGQTREQVIQKIGQPDRNASSVMTSSGTIIVDEYDLYPADQDLTQLAFCLDFGLGCFFPATKDKIDYYLRYEGDKLTSWDKGVPTIQVLNR